MRNEGVKKPNDRDGKIADRFLVELNSEIGPERDLASTALFLF